MVLLIGGLAFQLMNPFVTTAETPPAATPLSTDIPRSTNKRDPTEVVMDALQESTVTTTLEPGSKNSESGIVVEGSAGTTSITQPDPGSKNDGSSDPAMTMPEFSAQEFSASGTLISCGDFGDMAWRTTSDSFEVIRECSLTIPEDGWVYISADGSAGREDGEYEAQFRIGIDTSSGYSDSDRWINVYDDSEDGTDKSIAISKLEQVMAGTHTFYFVGMRYNGTGTVLVYDPTLSVIFIPAADSEVLACEDSGSMDWTTTSNGFEVIRQCSLSVPHEGWVYLSADSSVGRLDGEYEAQFRIGIDGTGGYSDSDRWINIYDDSEDGTDENVALSMLNPITPGTHTFYSLGKRFGGAGTVQLYDPTLSVIFIPSPGTAALACGTSGVMVWQTISADFGVIRECSLSVPQDGWVYLSADASVGREDGEYEAQFRIGIDGFGGFYDIDRWVNVYNDSDDGTDKTIAISRLEQVTAGTHTFYLLGKRFSGTGTVKLYNPTLTVIAPGAQVFLPLLMKGS